MKTFFKILSILIVAALVGGLLYGAVTGMSVGQGTRARSTNGEFNRRDHQNFGGGLQFPADSIKNLLIISIVAMTYLKYSSWVGRKKLASAQIR